jgi:hypothetical protein|tara:strand:+ start:539 stop:643 length:105 start_codon:yes stop_codon:yes gene_type:complete
VDFGDGTFDIIHTVNETKVQTKNRVDTQKALLVK